MWPTPQDSAIGSYARICISFQGNRPGAGHICTAIRRTAGKSNHAQNRIFKGGIIQMKKQDMETVNTMRLQGKSASEIAWTLGISVNTVRSHIRRHPELEGGKPCKNCGRPIVALPGRKEKLFCSDKCRMTWWNSHREQVQKKAYYRLTCTHCGKEFESYGNQNRKFCYRNCYLLSRRALSLPEAGAVSVQSGNPGHHAA